MIQAPISVYINWASYDELSDNVELTEALALQQLQEQIRLRQLGVQLDYYMMDAFWFAPDGAYRTFRKPHWPNGPDRWLATCKEHGIIPGLWVTSNTLCKLDLPEAWRDSWDGGNAFSCFAGGFLAHYLETLHQWVERGVGMFKFDFANFGAAPEALRRVMLPSEIRAANVSAFMAGLKAFRAAHPHVKLIGYNGLEEDGLQGNTTSPVRKLVDARWLEVFDSIYCGDPRPADVPAMNFWRSKDIYSDHMVRYYDAMGIPWARIDNSGFMIGTTGTCYGRRAAAWQGMLLLGLARGGWVNTYYGNLELIDATMAVWFAQAQALFLPLQAQGITSACGPLPGSGQPYGFMQRLGADAVLAVVNPSQVPATIALPAPAGPQRLLFRDAGFVPVLQGGSLTLGPEQLVLVGVGRYAAAACDLGVQADVVIPSASAPLAAEFVADGARALSTTVTAPAVGVLRLVVEQRDPRGQAVRSSGGSPPKGISMGQKLVLTAHQGTRAVPVTIQYDKAIWSGLSWAVGEVAARDLQPGVPVTLRATTDDMREVKLSGRLYHVRY